MSPEANQALRLGMWLVLALFVAGLLFLALGGRARAGELSDAPDEATRLLLAPEPPAAPERAREARELLDLDRNKKIAVISSALVDLGIRASFGASPIKLLQSAGELGQGLLSWSNRTRGEEQALLLLAPDALGGGLDEPTRALYDRLADRERTSLVNRLLDDSEKALFAGEYRRARIAVDRALELEPGSDRADRLLDALEGHDRRVATAVAPMSPHVAAWEVPVASALLVDAADRAPKVIPEDVELSEDQLRELKETYKLIRKTVDPVNLVLQAPARVVRDWQPDGSALREAATRYLELEPQGARAEEARQWLAKLGKDERASAQVSPFRDGYFMLPHARTHYAHVAPQRLVVSADALDVQAPELAHALGLEGSSAFILGDRGLPDDAKAIDTAHALELLARLGDGLDEGALQGRSPNQADVLEALRRLDARVRAGATLHAIARTPAALASLGDMGNAVVDGKRVNTYGDIALSRNDDRIEAHRSLGGDGGFCLADTPCIDRKLPVDGAVFAQTNATGSAGVGARAEYRQAQLSVMMSSSGPRASLVLPIARWLGIQHILPVEAHVDVGLDGISAGPRLDGSANDDPSQKL